MLSQRPAALHGFRGSFRSLQPVRLQAAGATRDLAAAKWSSRPTEGLQNAPRCSGFLSGSAAAAAGCMRNRHFSKRASADGAPEEGVEKSEAQGADDKTTWSRVRSWWSANKIDSKKLRQMGVMVMLSYGFISNVNAMALILIATFRAISVTGCSPFTSPASFRQFGITYAGLYLVSNIVRPARIAMAVALQPMFEGFVTRVEKTLSCKRGRAIVVVVIIANVFGTCALLAGGLFGISVVTGVNVKISQLPTLIKAGKSARATSLE
mmetsp:Transcript_44892/g.103853  ORF Transcript_44892/g.103853 Transcript_44892/m.103853 type:complete len:266 (-) Transcript_44892:164-961(-)